nr:MAG TPA: hypothetical protein [Caudoviricetes sp.]
MGWSNQAFTPNVQWLVLLAMAKELLKYFVSLKIRIHLLS